MYPKGAWQNVSLETRFSDVPPVIISTTTSSSKLNDKLKVWASGSARKPTANLSYQINPQQIPSAITKIKDGTYFSEGTEDVGQLKAILRNVIFLQTTDPKYTLLHASLIKYKNKHIAIAGGAGAGKTTYAQLLVERAGAKILANDYLVIRKENGALLASDLNFKSELKHSKSATIDAILICDPNPQASALDLWQPTQAQIVDLVLSGLSHLPKNKNNKKRIALFWKDSTIETPIFGINTRKRSIERTYRDFERVIKQIASSHQQVRTSVGVVGLGAVGTQVATLLTQKPWVKKVYLHNRSPDKQHGLSLDLIQASRVVTSETNRVIECRNFNDSLQADLSIICIREANPAKQKTVAGITEERLLKALPHLRIFRGFARELREAKYNGKILVVTNPVEMLTWFLYWFSNLDENNQFDGEGLSTDQVYGVGLALDKARAELATQEVLNCEVRVRPFIQHGEHLQLQITHPTKKITSTQREQILKKVHEASPAIRGYGLRTVHGPAAAALQTLEAVLGIKAEPAFLSIITRGYVVGGANRISRPGTAVPATTREGATRKNPHLAGKLHKHRGKVRSSGTQQLGWAASPNPEKEPNSLKGGMPENLTFT